MSEVGAALAVQSVLPANRGELCPVTTGFGVAPLMHLDRAWLASFGVISYGVHVNGYVDGPEGMEMWIGVRAGDRNVAPGKLDNVVAGGLTSGLGIEEKLIKEAAEEASQWETMSRPASQDGAESAVMARPPGVRTNKRAVHLPRL